MAMATAAVRGLVAVVVVAEAMTLVHSVATATVAVAEAVVAAAAELRSLLRLQLSRLSRLS